MDMKRILQALDNASTKPVEGASDMSKFLSIINKNDVSIIKEEINNNKVLNEGANPHKVTLPVQMAMQHYQSVEDKPVVKTQTSKLFHKYFAEAEETANQEEQQRKEHLKMYARKVANSVLENRQEREYTEAPIEPMADPNDPVIYGHEKANPMSLQGRIQQARNQLTQLAHMAESNDLVVWERICTLAKGGMFMGLEQNLEQIRHGISELAAKRKKGGTQSRGIDKNIG